MRVLRELADALAYAHECGVVHRDLKPENVLLSRGHALTTDFGVAEALSGAAADTAEVGVQVRCRGCHHQEGDGQEGFMADSFG